MTNTQIDLSRTARIFGLKDKLTFGKYRGHTLDDVARRNPEYIAWMRSNVSWASVSDEVWKLATSVGILNSEDRAEAYGTAGDFGFPEF